MTADTILIAAAGWHDEAAGGANKLPTDFARFLVARGRRVAYLCAGKGGEFSLPDKIDGVEVWRYASPRGASPSLANLLAHISASKRIARTIGEQSPVGIVLGHAPLQYLGATSGAGPTARRCYAVHSPFVAELKANQTSGRGLKHSLAWRLSAFLESRIYAISDLIHCDSAYSLIFVRREYPRAMRDKGLVLPGWVNTTQFTPAEDTPQEVRRKLGAPWDASIPTFFTLRRLVPRMGLSSLLAAAALLAGEGHAFRLVIGGAGPQLESLRSRARDLGVADHVSFLGFVPEHELADCFRAADCFVLPTQSLECFGLIILEAYACGVPVIGVPVGSIPEVVGPEFGHWQALDNSAEGLAERMRDFIMGKLRPDPAALRHRAMQFGFEAMAARHEQVLLNNVGVADICGIGMLS